MAKSGKLYVSKPRSGFAAAITRITVRLGELFGASNISATMKLADTERETAAAKTFENLVNNKLSLRGITAYISSENLSTPASYKQAIVNLIDTDSKKVAPVFNNTLSSSHELDPNDFSGGKALKSLQKKGIKIEPKHRQAFAETYNDLLNYNVSAMPALSSDEKIGASMDSDTVSGLLKNLAANPDILAKLSDYNVATEKCVNELVKAHKQKNPTALATAKLKLCCVLNSFAMDIAAPQLGLDSNDKALSMLQESSIEKAFSNMHATNTDLETLDKFFLATIAPAQSQATSTANQTITEIGLQGLSANIPMASPNGVEHYQARLVNPKALDSLNNVCKNHKRLTKESFVHSQKQGVEKMEGDTPEKQEVLNQSMQEFQSFGLQKRASGYA